MKHIVSSDKAPGAVGPYSQAVKTDNLLFVSGNLPIIPTTGKMAGDSVLEQALQVMENLKAVVEEAGLSMASIVKTTCFLNDMNDFAAFNEVYGRYFTENPPARECVEVARLPMDALVEVSAICDCVK